MIHLESFSWMHGNDLSENSINTDSEHVKHITNSANSLMYKRLK